MDEHSGGPGSHLTREPVERRMRGNALVRCGGRAGETGRERSRNRAPVRPYMIGKAGRSAMATLVERTSRYTVPVALPAGRRDATTTCDALIGSMTGLPEGLLKTLTWCPRTISRVGSGTT